MGTNDTCRTLRHYNEPAVVKLRGVDSQLDTVQCLFLKLGNDKCHGHTGEDQDVVLLFMSFGKRVKFNLIWRKT